MSHQIPLVTVFPHNHRTAGSSTVTVSILMVYKFLRRVLGHKEPTTPEAESHTEQNVPQDNIHSERGEDHSSEKGWVFVMRTAIEQSIAEMF